MLKFSVNQEEHEEISDFIETDFIPHSLGEETVELGG